WPQTFEDAGAAVDVLADLPGGVPLDTVVTIGHSAGGLLAVWAALRRQPRVPVSAAISQAGVLDINGAVRDGLGGGAAQQFFGAALPEALDPVACPATVPVFCVHAPDDDDVPIAQSRAYVAARPRPKDRPAWSRSAAATTVIWTRADRHGRAPLRSLTTSQRMAHIARYVKIEPWHICRPFPTIRQTSRHG